MLRAEVARQAQQLREAEHAGKHCRNCQVQSHFTRALIFLGDAWYLAALLLV